MHNIVNLRQISIRCLATFFSIVIFSILIAAQSPNTATVIVSVVDQNVAVVQGANISVVNTANGSFRDAVSGSEGSATIAALSLTGTYKVSVTKTGFSDDDVTGLYFTRG